MRTRMTVIVVAIMLAAALAGSVASAAPGRAATAAAACAKASVRATPKLNTQAGSTETLTSTITNCAAKSELIRVEQKLSLPGAFSGSFWLPGGRSDTITQHVPYRCCGTYYVTDRAYSRSGKLLSTSRASWTFA